ncbi:MAG: alpha/beta hydrolase [Acidobacteria bacterium]|nr:alpha/beta hydrolase [Acidobacteriota bacterium]
MLHALTTTPLLAAAAVGVRAHSAAGTQATPDGAYGAGTLPSGIRSRLVPGVNGITMHVLEAGHETPGRPGLLLVHGFPELGYSWRKVMLPLAAAGFHVMAPDQRGYGRSGGTDVHFDDDLAPFSTLNRVRDMMALVHALGHREVASVVGHDFGSPVAAWCALTRPDVFRAVVMMSAPFGGTARLPFNTANTAPPPAAPAPDMDAGLAALAPPRKHYQTYYTTREANENMWKAPQGLQAFLRAYYHAKSADWPGNAPHPLSANTPEQFALLPRYYVMDKDKGMADQVAADMPTAAQIAACQWLPDRELAVYAGEYGRTGFQGGLQSYRVGRVPRLSAELTLFAGRTIDVPATFISGKSDWGVFQRAGSFESMQKSACTNFRGAHLVDGAGHWVQQEQPAKVAELVLQFVRGVRV